MTVKTPDPNSNDGAPAGTTVVTGETTMWFQIIDSSGSPAWQYSTSSATGPWTAFNGLDDDLSSSGDVVANVANASGQNRVAVVVGSGSQSTSTINDNDTQVYNLGIPTSVGTTNDFKMTATFPSRKFHDPTFYVKRSS